MIRRKLIWIGWAALSLWGAFALDGQGRANDWRDRQLRR